MKKLLWVSAWVVIVLLNGSNVLQADTWAKRAGGLERDSGYGIAALPDGSALVTGYFRDSATFGAGEPNETTLVSPVSTDIFVAKYDPNGSLAWAKGVGSRGTDVGRGIDALPDGSALVTGHLRLSATFGAGEPNETTLNSAGHFDVFVAKYYSDGSLAWAKRDGGSDDEDSGSGIAVLPDGSALVTGYFGGSATFGAGEPNETTLVSPVSFDVFVAKYDPDGSLAWAKRGGGDKRDEGQGIAALPDGSALVTGDFRGSATFGAGEPNETTLISASAELDVFVTKYDPDGSLVWAKRGGGGKRDEGHGIAALPDGSALVTGFFEDSATFGAGEPNETTLISAGWYDVFVARYDPDGSLTWAKCGGGDKRDEGHGIATLPDGSALVTGYSRGSAIFGAGEPNETTLDSTVSAAGFMAKYDPDGSLVWAKREGKRSRGGTVGQGVASLPDGSALVTGRFSGSVTFGAGGPNETTLIPASDSPDVFVAKYGNAPL